MLELISAALVMGFGTGFSCMAFCVPLVVPYSGSIPEPNWKRGLLSATLFSFGRLVSYSCLLVVMALVKSFLPDNNLTEALATLITGLIALTSALVTLRIINWSSGFGRLFCNTASGANPPFFMGLLTGFRPCPPLLAALAYVLTLDTLLQMGLFLTVFWMTTSLPILSIGAASGGAAAMLRQKLGEARIRRISGIALGVVGVVFILQAIGMLTR